MRQTYLAGDKLFVDWAGDTVPIIDAMTGEVHEAHLFIAVLGASSYTYAEARWSETLPDWIGAHVNALDFLGGVPKAAVPDNLKAGITKPSRYEPGVNRTYQDLADHYGFVVLPARVRRPRDKAKVEAAVGIVSRFLLGKLRNRRFFSLVELNDAVRDCVTKINTKVMKHLKQSRNDLFASIDRPALKGFRASATNMPSGSAARSRPTIMSRSMTITTRSRSGCCARPWRRASRTEPSRSSTRASGLRATSARASRTSTPRSRSTCRRAIGVTRNARRHGCCARPRRSAPPRSRCSRRS
jgi:hypothetical protein